MDFSKHTDGTTSVKVHHAPGGKSNFSIGWDGQNEAPKKQAPPPQVVQPVNPQPQPSSTVPHAHKNEQSNNSNPDNKTSVKVHNPPGGKSNFTLG